MTLIHSLVTVCPQWDQLQNFGWTISFHASQQQLYLQDLDKAFVDCVPDVLLS